ncbi:MAG: YdeI/OmpD-associated family protein [Pseudomonadota bacterium]
MAIADLEQIEFTSRHELRRWLADNHRAAAAFWLVSYKKHRAEEYIAYGDIVEELLCFGWIDSRTRRLDDDRTMLLVSPRKGGSTWSAANKTRLKRLRKAGLLTSLAEAQIAEAKKDRSWYFLDDIEKLVVPADLQRALDRNPRARDHFSAFGAAAKKVILLWIKTAKRAQTREQRVREAVRLAAMNVKAAHPEARGR